MDENQIDWKNIPKTMDGFLKNLDEQGKRKNERALKNNNIFEKRPEKFQDYSKEYFQRDTWLILNEAIPLSMGIHPTDWSDMGIKPSHNKILTMINSDVSISLTITNPNEKVGLWRAKPKDYYDWLIAKNLDVSEAFKIAMRKNGMGINKTNTKKGVAHGNTENHLIIREQVFKAAVSVLVNFYDDCIHGKKISASKVARQIYDKSPLFFNNDEIGVELPTIERFIREAIRMAKKK